ncbi:hypothetical protein BGZ60DRAFT_470332 [Tricladium varicosporioides]|nr:hypothetical protein BGZ60DRAFT_470332 [Hymenoscyphus varicosporioides]
MANEDILTDDYVAGLLTKDARESSIKYSAMGLEGLVNSRPPANKPKPNTRFLRNIIKDTDSHNAALLAKEAAESRARLDGLAGNEYRERKASRIGGGDIRKRQLGDIAAILGGRSAKRKRTDTTRPSEAGIRRRRNTSSGEDEPKKMAREEGRREYRSRDQNAMGEERSSKHRSSRQDHRSTSPNKEDSRHVRIGHKSTSRDRTRDDYKKRRRSTSRERERDPAKDERSRQQRRSSRERIRFRGHQGRGRRSRSRSRSPNEHCTKPHHRDRSPRRKRSRSPGEASKKSQVSHCSPSVDRKSSKRVEKRIESQKEEREDYDSDPLDDIIGPRPPLIPEVRSRGRGTVSRASGIDSRFSADYDPTADVQLDFDEENDWDQALEALKDRQKWKQKGADRLRAAGFTDDDIKKWEDGGERREEDVKWAKKGEGREWDRGKVLDEDGVVSFDPAFGRLKDT